MKILIFDSNDNDDHTLEKKHCVGQNQTEHTRTVNAV